MEPWSVLAPDKVFDSSAEVADNQWNESSGKDQMVKVRQTLHTDCYLYI